MLELLSQINPDELINIDLNIEEKKVFKDNIYFISFSNDFLNFSDEEIINLDKEKLLSLLKIKNLTKSIHDSTVVDKTFDEILFEIKDISYFKSFYNFLLSIKNEFKLEYPTKIYNIFTSDNLLKFNYKKDGQLININSIENSGNFIGGSGGQKSWLFGLSYGAKSTSKFDNEIKFIKNKLLCLDITENTLSEFNKYIDYKIDISIISDKINLLRQNSYFDEVVDTLLNNLVFDSSSTQIFITDYFGLNNYFNFDIEKIHTFLSQYYFNNPKTNPSLLFTDVKTGICRCCLKEKTLYKNNNYSSNFQFNTHVFNIHNTKTNKKFDNNSFFVCNDCSQTLDNINNTIVNQKLGFIKIGYNEFHRSIKRYNSLSEIHSSGYENIDESVFYKIIKDDLSKNSHTLLPVLVFNKNIQEKKRMSENFIYLQTLFNFKSIKMNWLDIIYKNKFSDEKKIVQIERFIQNNSSDLKEFWIDDIPLSPNKINKIIILFLNSISSNSDNIYFYFLSLFNFLTDVSKSDLHFDKIIELEYSNNKLKKYGVHNSVYDNLTLKKGEKNMFEKHNEINNKLSIIDNVKNQLETIDFDFDNDSFWILYGRVLGYLNSKSKSENQNLDYLNNLRQISNKKLLNILQNSFFKYSYDIKENQIKFKIIYSFILEDLMHRKINENTLSHILSGVLNNKIIKLTLN